MQDRIDEPARRDERKSARSRMQLSARTGRRLLLVAVIYVAGFSILTALIHGIPRSAADVAKSLGSRHHPARVCVLQVVPALLAVEVGTLHHEFRNIELSWRLPNEAARTWSSSPV